MKRNTTIKSDSHSNEVDVGKKYFREARSFLDYILSVKLCPNTTV